VPQKCQTQYVRGAGASVVKDSAMALREKREERENGGKTEQKAGFAKSLQQACESQRENEDENTEVETKDSGYATDNDGNEVSVVNNVESS
jgi:hypothetical protein